MNYGMSKYLVIYIFIFMVNFTCVQAAENECTKTQEEICSSYYADLTEMRSLLNEIKTSYADDKDTLDKIQHNQDLWQSYHDGYIVAMYDEEYVSPSSDRHLCVCLLLEPVVQVRLQQLRYWRDGTIEGDVCAGHVHFSPAK